jgi:two-component system sensor histidine kinase HydH
MSDAGTMLEAVKSHAMTPSDLGELVSAFSEVTARLEGTHAQLRAEVARLSSELREANEQLQRSRRLAALGEMAAGISHEIRNPLASIRLYARMLEEDLADRPEQQCNAQKIGGAVSRLDAIVGDVLSFAREMRIRPEPVSTRELFDDALCMCEIGSTRVAREGDDLSITADPTLTHQALVNLVRNAVDAGGDAITLSARRETEIDGSGVARLWSVLGVCDTGPGIEPDVIERMFNPFFTTRATGTGLGLAIVHRILDAHGGRVEVRNNAHAQPGAPGATVELWLPEREASRDQAAQPSQPKHADARTAAA